MKFLIHILPLALFLIISSCSSKQKNNHNETHDKSNDINSTAFVPLSEFMSDIDIYADAVYDEMIEELPEEEITPEEAANKLGKGIQSEIVLPNGEPITLITDNSIKEWGSGSWQRKGHAIELYTGEGSTYYTIICGYLFIGSYDERTGNCCVEEWDDVDQSFYDYCYHPVESANGKILKSLKWYMI